MKPIVISGKGERPVLQPHEIICVEAANKYSCVRVNDPSDKEKGYRYYPVCSNLKKFQPLLRSKIFQQVHRSYIVNINYICGLGTRSLTLRGKVKKIVPLSKQFRAQLLAKLALIK
jgi:DNA-binding LytR/AlgR family response regulator